MDIYNETSYSIGYIAGRMSFPNHSLTLIVKAAFDLVPDGTARPSPEQSSVTGDEFYDDDHAMQGAPRYASDFAYFKPRADLLLVGRCHAPKAASAPARRVTFAVGGTVNTLTVYGDRYWKGPVATDPEPFSKIPIRYEYSYGGSGFDQNPTGRGYTKSLQADGGTKRFLPNITRPGEYPATPLSRLTPAGFGPIPQHWEPRRSRLGAYGKVYLQTRWPWFGGDMDWRFFNVSPEALQSDYLKGDEELYFENLHPEHPNFRTRLPGIRIRCFLNKADSETGDDGAFFEVAMNLDTLWADLDNDKVVLVWRGWTPVRSEEFEELRHLLVVSESADRKAESLHYFQDRLQQHIRDEEELWEETPPPPTPEPEIAGTADELIAGAETAYRQAMRDAGLDPDAPPAPSAGDRQKAALMLEALGFGPADEPAADMTREAVVSRFAATKDLAALDLAGLDLSGIDFSGGNLRGTVFSRANLAGCAFEEADLTEAVFAGAVLSGSRFRAALLTDADFSRADCRQADLRNATMTDTVFDNARMAEARMDAADAVGASFIDADLAGASFVAAVLTGADLSAGTLTKADFTNARLDDATLEGVNAQGIVMDAADLNGLRAAEGSDFAHGSFKQASGTATIWEKADLSGADFSFARLEGAGFSKARMTHARLRASDMKNARFDKADLKHAQLAAANFLESSFEKADLTRCDCRRANFYGSEFLDAVIDHARFDGANLKMTKLAGRRVER